MWILPSYNRPEQCAENIARLIEHGCSTPGILIANGGNTHDEYDAITLTDDWKILHLEENLGVCGALNHAYALYPSEPFYGFFGDDDFIKTDGWDKILIEAAGKWNIACGNIGVGNICETVPVGYITWGGELIRTIGSLSLKGLWHLYFDNYWARVASECGLLRYCPEVQIEVRHHSHGTATKDATNTSSNLYQKQDDAIFTHWRNDRSDNGAIGFCSKLRHKINKGKLNGG